MSKPLTRGEWSAGLVVSNFAALFALYFSGSISEITAFIMLMALGGFIYKWSNAPKDVD